MARTVLNDRQVKWENRAVQDVLEELQTRMDAIHVNQSTGFSTRSGAGAIPITHKICKLTTTGADALTIAAGALDQEIEIVMVVDGGDGTLTGTFNPSLTSIVFNDARDSVRLKMDATGWVVLSNSGTTIT